MRWRHTPMARHGVSFVGCLLIAGMIAVVAVNLIQFALVEARGRTFFSALHHRDDAVAAVL